MSSSQRQRHFPRMIYVGGKQIKEDAENDWWWTCWEARLCVTKLHNDQISQQCQTHTSIPSPLFWPSSPLNFSPCFIPLMIKRLRTGVQVSQLATMLARARVQGPQLTAGTANLIMQAWQPHSLISCCTLLRGRLPDVNLLGPEHNPTLGQGPGISQGSRKLTAMKMKLPGVPRPSPWCR